MQHKMNPKMAQLKERKIPRYFIKDCNEKIVGNSLGYSTYSEASQAQSETDGIILQELWLAYEKKQLKDNNWTKIGSIKTM